MCKQHTQGRGGGVIKQVERQQKYRLGTVDDI